MQHTFKEINPSSFFILNWSEHTVCAALDGIGNVLAKTIIITSSHTLTLLKGCILYSKSTYFLDEI